LENGIDFLQAPFDKMEVSLSFSSIAKDELARLPLGKPCCMLSELAALLHTSASLSLKGGGQVRLAFQVESPGLARRIFLLLRTLFQVSPKLHFVLDSRLGGRRKSIISLENKDAQTLLLAFGMMAAGEDGQMNLVRTTPRRAPLRQCCRKAFLRGAFLGAGSVTSPEKGYHFEIVAADPDLSTTLLRLMEKSGLPGKQMTRKGTNVVYLKGSEQIVSALGMMGASQALLSLENTRVHKNVMNHVNRMMNCDTSNMEKQLDAATRQIEAIRALSLSRGLGALPPSLQQVARLRLSQPEATLTQLGEMLDPPLGKSGVNHRLRRIVALSQALTTGKEEES
jgi:DNA-binding protein WhiA